jgi:hypothetical protein
MKFDRFILKKKKKKKKTKREGYWPVTFPTLACIFLMLFFWLFALRSGSSFCASASFKPDNSFWLKALKVEQPSFFIFYFLSEAFN